MKKTLRVLSIVCILVMTLSMGSFAFAANETTAAIGGGLNLTGTYPERDSTGAAIENFSIKLYFDGDLATEESRKANESKVKLVDEEGTELPVMLVYAPSEDGVALVIFDKPKAEAMKTDDKKFEIKGDTAYTFTIDGSFTDDNGNTLGKDEVITIETFNQSRNQLVSVLLMFVLYGGIAVFAIRGAKKKDEKAEKEKAPQTVNPYKEAKRTGKSVEEIVEADKKAKEKYAAKEAKKAAKEAEEDDGYIYLEEGHYLVKSIRTVQSGGSTYVTGRKAAAEAKRAQEEKWKQTQKKKGKKK